jgi:hypothetical protein
MIHRCSLAWAYLREQLRAWRSDEDEEPAEGGPEPAESPA